MKTTGSRLQSRKQFFIMWKRLVILSIAATFLGGAWAQVARNGSDQNGKPKATQPQTRNVPPAIVRATSQDESSQKKASSREELSQYPWRELYAPANVSNWVLAIVGIVGVIVAVRTLMKIERQTRATEHAANAALKQANHLAASERARIVIDKGTGEPNSSIHKPYLLPHNHPDAPKGRDILPHCIFFIRNAGRTPARIIGWKAEMQLGESTDSPPDLSVFEIGNAPTRLPYILAQGSIDPYEARLRTSYNLWKVNDLINDRKGILWLCGVLQYEDVFAAKGDIARETAFCYQYETRFGRADAFWIMAGPPECNRST